MGQPDLQPRRAIADFEPHAQSWVLWPLRPDNWRENAGPAQSAFVSLAKALLDDEALSIGAPVRAVESVRGAAPRGARVLPMEYDDVWIRDTGPVFIEWGSEIAGVDWRFNSWGGGEKGLFGTWAKDDSVARQILKAESIPMVESKVVLEGGAVALDGRGTLITTRECLLSPNRNTSMAESDYERVFADLLGVQHVVWLDEGLADDEAGGHIDNLVAFLAPGKLLVVDPISAPRSQRQRIENAVRALQSARDADGDRFELVFVPLPPAITISETEAAGFAPPDGAIQRHAGTQMVASYINFVFTNKRILVPLFDDLLDEAALNILRDVAGARSVHGVPSRELVLGGGALHCVVAHQPIITSTGA